MMEREGDWKTNCEGVVFILFMEIFSTYLAPIIGDSSPAFIFPAE